MRIQLSLDFLKGLSDFENGSVYVPSKPSFWQKLLWEVYIKGLFGKRIILLILDVFFLIISKAAKK